MRATNRTPMEHYREEYRKARSEDRIGRIDAVGMIGTDNVQACPKVPGGLGIPKWRPIRKSTAKWMIKNGKLPPTPENLARAGMKKTPGKRKPKKSTEEKFAELLEKLQQENVTLKDL
jgi:hypothetical protein